MSFGAAYLSAPDLFPVRHSGEPWGGRDLCLSLPEGPYRLIGVNDEQQRAMATRYGNLTTEASAASEEVEIRVFRASSDDFLGPPTAPMVYAPDFDSGPVTLRIAGLQLMGRVDWRPRMRCALWTDAPAGPAFAAAVENYLRPLVAFRLMEGGGAMLHSAGIAPGPCALLCIGPSGAGKSTLTGLARGVGHPVLSDDLNAVFSEGGVARAVALPFTGDLERAHSSRQDYPLAAILRLEKSPRNALRRLTPAAAVAALVSCCPFVNADPYRGDRLVETLAALIDGVPAYALEFSLDGGVWPLLVDLSRGAS